MQIHREAPDWAQDLGLIPLDRENLHNSMWGNILRADDDCIYVAAGNHETYDADVSLFRFDPRDDSVRTVASSRAYFGHQAGTAAVGESKIHTRLLQAADGLLYFSTMQGGIGHLTKLPHYTHPSQYPGGHLWTYDPATEQMTDLGILVRGEGLQTAAMDRERERIYFISWPKKMFVRYDMRTRQTKVLGVMAWSPTTPQGVKANLGRDVMIGENGKVYAINNFGCLVIYSPETDTLDDTDILVNPADSLRANVRDGHNLYFATSQGFLYQLDTRTDTVTTLGPVTPEGAVYSPNLMLSPDKTKLIYMAGSHGAYMGSSLLLISFDLASRTHRVHGMLDTRFWPPYCYGSTVDARGRWVFALHGGEPANSYLAIYDPQYPETANWLVEPQMTPDSAREIYMGPGTEGRTRGWIVAPYTPLTTSSHGPIPNDQSAVTSLLAGDDAVYGATTAIPGRSAYLFRTSSGGGPAEVVARLADHLPSAQSVRGGLAWGSDGRLYGGTIDLLEDRFGSPCSSTAPLPLVPENYAGGCLFSYGPRNGAIRHLGDPVPGEGIYALCANPDGSRIYALTYPSAKLVEYQVASGKLAVVAAVYPPEMPALLPTEHHLAGIRLIDCLEYESRKTALIRGRGLTMANDEMPDDVLMKKAYVSRAIVCDADGNVYGSAAEGHLFCYRPKTGTLEILEARIPITVGTEYGLIAEPSVETLIRTRDGQIYGGTSQDGYLFRFDPATQDVVCLGKPDVQSRIRALAEWRDGIYGVVGENLGKTHLFRYDTTRGSLDDLGVLQGGGRVGFAVNICESMATGPDDQLYIGQAERISALLHIDSIDYQPWQSP